MTGICKDDWSAQLALMEAYDQTYGIYDHERYGNIDPMSVIGMHPSEDYITGSRLDLITRDVLSCRLPELTNTPLLELLSYPRWFLEKLIKDGRRARSKEEQTVDELEDQLRKNAGK